MNRTAILWLDSLGALLAGAVVMLFSSQLSRWEGLPQQVVAFLGIANLAYGGYSLCVTLSRPRRLGLIRALAVGNMAWLFVCLSIAISFRDTVTSFGLFHLLGEGIYVAGLGFTEWRWQRSLVEQ